MQKSNRAKILSLLVKYDLLSRGDLARLASVSPAVVSHIIRECLMQGIVQEVSSGVSRGGRRPVLLAFNPDTSLVGGLIPGPQTQFCVGNLAGKTVMEKGIEPKKLSTPSRLALHIKELLNNSTVGESTGKGIHLRCMGIGIPGIYDQELDTIHKIGRISGLAGWEGKNVRTSFEDVFSCPILVFDKVVAIAYAENIVRSSENIKNLVYLHLGKGIGAGLVLEGRVYRGSQGAAGEVGYMACTSDREMNHALHIHEIPFLESRLSVNYVLDQFRSTFGIKEKSNSELQLEMIEYFNKKDPRVRNLLHPVFHQVGMMAVNITAVLNPDIFILGGELTEMFFQEVKDTIENYLAKNVLFPPEVEKGTFGSREEMKGTLYFAIDSYLRILTGGMQGLQKTFLERYCR